MYILVYKNVSKKKTKKIDSIDVHLCLILLLYLCVTYDNDNNNKQ